MKTITEKNKKQKDEPRIPYHKKPSDITTVGWQVALRRQFAKDNPFGIKNIGEHPVFSDFKVHNPATGNSYKVAIRSADGAMNFCTCMDFKTNLLGTCKHIEAVLHKLNDSDLNKKFLQKKFSPPYSSIYLNYGETRSVQLRIGTDNSEIYREWAQQYFDKYAMMQNSAYDAIEQIIREARAINDDFRCYDDALEYIIQARAIKQREQFLEKITDNKNYLDNLIKAKLFPYQQEGIRFAFRTGRCLIADDMGLGKTIQAIGAAEMMKKEKLISKALIVCPTSLKYQWKSEIEKFTNETAIAVVEGNLLKREACYKNDDFYKIISYNVVKNDLPSINTAAFDMVILDEAQRIKNWKTNVAQNVKKIKSDYAIVLTSTPLENKIEELYSIVQFVDGFKLGPLYHFLESHQIKNETGKVTGYKELNKVGEVLKDIVIRRTKKEVLTQLPERMDKNLFVPMTQKQMEIHNDYADSVAKLVNKWKRFGFLNEQDRQRLMIALNMMRMVCDSTFIIDQETRHDTKVEELMCILDNFFESSEEKVVVFSQWERMTRLVAQELDARGIGYQYLHGGVPSNERKKLYENFNDNPACRVFLSTDAGGVGLNLQVASLLINLDIPWNPAVLEQRVGRIHRLGQKRNMNIINLVATGTIEHRMLDVLKFKSALAQGILDNGEDTIFMGEGKFKEFMKSVENMTTGIERTEAVTEETTGEEKETIVNAVPLSEEQEAMPEAMSRLDDDQPVNEQTAHVQITGQNKQHDENYAPVASGNGADAEAITRMVSSGISFLGQLVQTLSDPQASKNLVNTIVEKDPSSGKTFLKLPVENEKVVENAILALGNIFKMFGKQ